MKSIGPYKQFSRSCIVRLHISIGEGEACIPYR